MMRLLAIAAVCLSSFAASPAVQQGTRAADLIPRDVLFDNPERAAPQISPDGKKLAWLAPDQGVLNVWVRSLGKTDDRAVTSDRKRGIRNYFWQQDSNHVLYVQDSGGDENWRVYQAEVAGGKTRDLTPFDKVQAQIIAASPRAPGPWSVPRTGGSAERSSNGTATGCRSPGPDSMSLQRTSPFRSTCQVRKPPLVDIRGVL